MQATAWKISSICDACVTLAPHETTRYPGVVSASERPLLGQETNLLLTRRSTQEAQGEPRAHLANSAAVLANKLV
jgi:hypothetical protein